MLPVTFLTSTDVQKVRDRTQGELMHEAGLYPPGSAANMKTACKMDKATASIKWNKARSPERVSDPDTAKKE